MKLLPVAVFAVFCVAFTYANSCKLCEELAVEINTVIEEEEPQIEQEANQICAKITRGQGEWEKWCHKVIDNELKVIVDLLKNNETPEQVCHFLDYC